MHHHTGSHGVQADPEAGRLGGDLGMDDTFATAMDIMDEDRITSMRPKRCVSLLYGHLHAHLFSPVQDCLCSCGKTLLDYACIRMRPMCAAYCTVYLHCLLLTALCVPLTAPSTCTVSCYLQLSDTALEAAAATD